MRGEGSPSEVDELITDFVWTCDDDSYFDADKFMTYREEKRSDVDFFKVRGGDVITCAQKSQDSAAASTVPVTIVSCDFS